MSANNNVTVPLGRSRTPQVSAPGLAGQLKAIDRGLRPAPGSLFAEPTTSAVRLNTGLTAGYSERSVAGRRGAQTGWAATSHSGRGLAQPVRRPATGRKESAVPSQQYVAGLFAKSRTSAVRVDGLLAQAGSRKSVGREGIEPPQPKAADLQSAPSPRRARHEFSSQFRLSLSTEASIFAKSQLPILFSAEREAGPRT